ncbi:glycosyl transferase group 1 [Chloroherpeton thalassium ATCC 35110]|uniref:Glycosyl transferase group 1 n=1 Tax=Chloroherpeton thalassium (strain ATCC 35110 / GB-78) TaxID=517418 RepID=B3QYT6_CHLT3|nr:glycosyltransferase family 4 protein [Chloroherpeton thalassium]ACF15159.1 glycosyl transferase group 1 [Chloroherpeton thalassium ATCC 35110]
MKCKIGVAYPFGCQNLVKPSNGAEYKVSLLAKFLKEEKFADVRFLSINRCEFKKQDENITYHDAPYPTVGWVKSLDFLIRRILYRKPIELDFSLWAMYKLPSYDSKVIAEFEELAKWADIVLFECVHFAPMGIPILQKHGKKSIVIIHDVVFELFQPKYKWITKIVSKIEIDAVQQADHIISLTEHDAKRFQQLGVKKPMTVLPLPTEKPVIQRDAVKSVQEKYQIDEKSLMFIGGYNHNVHAAEKIMDIIAPKLPEYKFYILGSVCNAKEIVQREAKNVIKVGRVSDDEKHAFYELCTFCLVPVFGVPGGFSTKLVEALSYGMVILTTALGARGVTFEHDKHGVVCDDFESYPERIRSLNDSQKQAYSQAALELSEKYNYKTVYRDYLPIIESLLK